MCLLSQRLNVSVSVCVSREIIERNLYSNMMKEVYQMLVLFC